MSARLEHSARHMTTALATLALCASVASAARAEPAPAPAPAASPSPSPSPSPSSTPSSASSLSWRESDESKDEDEGGWSLLAYGQLFASYEHQRTQAQSFHEFTLRRAELGLGFMREGVGGFVVNTEAIRSAGPQSLFGVDNNSIVMRIKHAFAQAQPRLGPLTLSLRAGMIPDVWVESVEDAYDLRGIDPILAERGQFYDTSDLGASAVASMWDRAVEFRLAMMNGEGRNERELNSGKNATMVVVVRPLQRWLPERAEVALHASYRDGSIGPSSLPNHRLAFALTGRWRRAWAGLEYIQATGYPSPVAAAAGSPEASGLGAWLNGPLYGPWLGAFGLYKRWTPDRSRQDGAVEELQAGLYLDAIDGLTLTRSVLGFPRQRLYVSYMLQRYGEGVAPTPGAPELGTTHALMVTLSARASFLED